MNRANAFTYQDSLLRIEEIPITTLAARFATPLYVYSEHVLHEQYARLERALQGLAPNVLVCYALKANANPTIGRLLAGWGAGADVVSGGELYLAQRMGFPGDKTVFAGVGKTRREMAEGLAAQVRSFHVESSGELETLASVAAEMGVVAPVAVRVNPDIEAHTHPHITTGTRTDKFGVNPAEAHALMSRVKELPSLRAEGLHAHIGSQLPGVQPIVATVKLLLQLWDQLAAEGIHLRELDIGGGLGIPYRPDEQPEGPEELAEGLRPLLQGRALDLIIEPGRFIVGPAGLLLTTVNYIKTVGSSHHLAVVDAGMNDLLRPALYGAWHPVWPARQPEPSDETVDVVGPVCESADVLARDRRLGEVRPGDILAIGQAGAYGYSMASQYNARPRPAEVLISGSEARLIRRREAYDDFLSGTLDLD